MQAQLSGGRTHHPPPSKYMLTTLYVIKLIWWSVQTGNRASTRSTEKLLGTLKWRLYRVAALPSIQNIVRRMYNVEPNGVSLGLYFGKTAATHTHDARRVGRARSAGRDRHCAYPSSLSTAWESDLVHSDRGYHEARVILAYELKSE